MRAARVLKAGMLLQIAGDVRWTGQHTAPARFLGHEYNFSSTWATLAAMTGAPVVPVFCRMDEDGSYHLEFRPAFHIPADAPKTIGIAAWVQTCLSEIEDRVRLDPANSNEYLFWADEAEKAVAG
jgi:KDO2-lipid IV(A) lauroyltransferase